MEVEKFSYLYENEYRLNVDLKVFEVLQNGVRWTFDAILIVLGADYNKYSFIEAQSISTFFSIRSFMEPHAAINFLAFWARQMSNKEQKKRLESIFTVISIIGVSYSNEIINRYRILSVPYTSSGTSQSSPVVLFSVTFFLHFFHLYDLLVIFSLWWLRNRNIDSVFDMASNAIRNAY